jgi:hypothetical protein
MWLTLKVFLNHVKLKQKEKYIFSYWEGIMKCRIEALIQVEDAEI